MKKSQKGGNDISGIHPDKRSYNRSLAEKFKLAQVERNYAELKVDYKPAFRVVKAGFQVLDRLFDITLEADLNRFYKTGRLDIMTKFTIEPSGGQGLPPCLVENESFKKYYMNIKRSYFADLLATTEFKNEDLQILLHVESASTLDGFLSIGKLSLGLKFFREDSGMIFVDGEWKNLNDPSYPLLATPRFKAINAYARSAFNDTFECDFTQIINDPNGESLGHWAAWKGILPVGYQQLLLTDSSGKAVIETALGVETLPMGFNDFGLKFKSNGKEISVAEYIKANNINRLLEDVAKYESKELSNQIKVSPNSVFVK